MRLILLGPPGSGKGTQAALLSQRKHLEHISTGDLLRAAIRQRTQGGERARPYVESGQLVPDELVNDLIAERFHAPDRPERFIMDGYPRTLAQAGVFDRVLAEHHLGLSAVLLLQVDDQEIVRRIAGRWSCPNPTCKRTYNMENNPPRVAGICDACGTALVQRSDDRPETVRQRQLVYHRDTAELIPYYRSRNLLREVLGQGEIEQVYNNLMRALEPQAGTPC
jgi:adenylate kinase